MTQRQTKFTLSLAAICFCGAGVIAFYMFALPTPPASTPDAGTTPSAPGSLAASTISLPQGLAENEQNPAVDAHEQLVIAQVRENFEALKKNGRTKWGSETWMKEPAYYAKLNMEALAEDCFSRPIFGNEMGIYQAITGLESLRVFHNGFGELLGRPDMWKGILHAYDYLGAKIDVQANLSQIVSTSTTLGTMGKLYAISPLREQLKGREQLFFDANLRVLKRYDLFLQNFDPGKLGTNGSAGFFGEPTWITDVALSLAQKVDPLKHAQVAPVLTGKHWGAKQDVNELRDYIHLVVQTLDGFPAK